MRLESQAGRSIRNFSTNPTRRGDDPVTEHLALGGEAPGFWSELSVCARSDGR